MPSRIVIDARTGVRSGIGRYTRGLLDHLQQLDETATYVVLLDAGDAGTWEPHNSRFRVEVINCPFYSWREQVALPRVLRRLRPDLVHFTNFNAPLLYFGARVTTIHDLNIMRIAQLRPDEPRSLGARVRYAAMRVVLERSVRASARILTPTEYVKSDVRTHWPRLPAEVVVVTHEAAEVSPSVEEQAVESVQTPYLLYVGNSYPHKNLACLIDGFAQASDRDLSLVLVGQEDDYRESLRRRAARSAASERILFPGYVSDPELTWLYRHATAFAFPSLSEGFGLPPLEAMAHGLPVICSDATCIPEVCGDAAAYFDPSSPSDIARVIDEAVSNPAKLAEMRAAGLQQAARFSWDQMAAQTSAAYVQAVASS